MNLNLEKLDNQNLANKKIINEINKNFTEFNTNLNIFFKKTNLSIEQLNSRIDLLDVKLNNLHTTVNFLFADKLKNIPEEADKIENSSDKSDKTDYQIHTQQDNKNIKVNDNLNYEKNYRSRII